MNVALQARLHHLASHANPVAVAQSATVQAGADESSTAQGSSTDTSNTASADTPTPTTNTTTSNTQTNTTNMFLTLLVAEIQNQDPTEPTDPTEYISQLSSMALVTMGEAISVEMNTNAILMSNLQVMALGNMVGDEIMVQTTSVNVSDETIHGRITLQDASTTVDLHFTDAAGNDYTVALGEQSPGTVDFDINPADYGIPPGDYQVSVVTNTGEEEIPIEVAGEVEDVRIPLDGSTPQLAVTGIGEVPFTAISQFGLPNDDSGSDASDVI